MTTESRKNIRLEVSNVSDDHGELTFYSVDMSGGGLFLETDTMRPVDTPLVIKFKLPGTDAVIVCNSRVAWINEPGDIKKSSLPPGMGIQFLDLSLENPIKIRELFK